MLSQTLLTHKHYDHAGEVASGAGFSDKNNRKIERMVKELSKHHPFISDDTIRQVVISYYNEEAKTPYIGKKFVDWVRRRTTFSRKFISC